MNLFDKEYRRIINEYREDNLIDLGLGSWIKNKFGKKEEKPSNTPKKDRKALCKKMWNNKQYKELAKEINLYKKEDSFKKDTDAKYYYGMLLLKGLAVERKMNLTFKSVICESAKVEVDENEKEVVKSLSKDDVEKVKALAEKGDADSLYDYAIYHYVGVPGIIEKDVNEAFQLFIKAAKAGSPEAAYNLGVMYLMGYDLKDYEDGDTEYGNDFELAVEKNNKEALKWYKKAIEGGYEDAKKPYQELSEKVKIETSDIEAMKVSTNKEKAIKGIKYLMSAAEEGCFEACDQLIDIFSDGLPGIVKSNLKQVLKYKKIKQDVNNIEDELKLQERVKKETINTIYTKALHNEPLSKWLEEYINKIHELIADL